MAAQTEAAWLTTVARSGETEAELVARLSGIPAEGLEPEKIRQEKFDYGLAVVLDGLASRLTCYGGPH